ncbi:unnamed protein product [Darwinula stevensoni]|uniref:mRNA m(6)A methyltransferase n=1 Tax=Darwinula stevensoni TaxID=69355 RepID=A0A7R8X593_9CRUS|nr:unnamed protein product [Darwinula stevensoni]CAG0878512.1 unnamed protein product [Darwinula stevensoni]
MDTQDTWKELKELQEKRTLRRERFHQRKKERETLLNFSKGPATSATAPSTQCSTHPGILTDGSQSKHEQEGKKDEVDLSPEIEKELLLHLCDVLLTLPTDSRVLTTQVSRNLKRDLSHSTIENLLQKFALQELISLQEGQTTDGKKCTVITSMEHDRLMAVASEGQRDGPTKRRQTSGEKEDTEKGDGRSEDERRPDKVLRLDDKRKKLLDSDIHSLLSRPSIKEKESKKVGEEILVLLSKPTVKELSLAERFRSQGGATVQEFCTYGTREECTRELKGQGAPACKKLHFRKIIQKHTDESLGDCSFLNTCFHMDSCKYVHYEVDYEGVEQRGKKDLKDRLSLSKSNTVGIVLFPPQWIQCDLRYFDMTTLGKFSVVMADPPWDIHMELPYGTMSDQEMRALNVPSLQDEGLIFLWVTGRAMELGRECLSLWGYERVDEIVWVKTNQLQRIIRTGRTGHWLNHGKEHCLVGMKGNPKDLNRGLDGDVIVAEVRATSHKPDEIYGIIERLSPGTRKIELFGRQHNVQPNWITLGNQLDGVKILDPDMAQRFYVHYPDGQCLRRN